MTQTMTRVVVGTALVCLTATFAVAQQATTTETKKFEVIAVDGNQLVVRLPEGTREITVPAGFRFNVDGKMMSVNELKPGMSGTATITTTTTQIPVTVTEVKNGTVMHASAGTIIVRTDEGIKSFTQSDIDKRGIKIMRGGKPAQISDFRANDRLSATIITTKAPQVVTEQEVQATLAKSKSATPSGAPAATAPSGQTAATATTARPAAPPPTAATRAPSAAGAPAASTAPAGASASTAAAKKQLPKTASSLPLLALVGLGSVLTGLGLTARRRRATR